MKHYEVNAPTVVGEVIDGEAVIMDLKTGHYYSSLGVGAVVWNFIEAGCSLEAIEQTLVSHFPEAAAVIPDDLAEFWQQLLSNNLIRPGTDQANESSLDGKRDASMDQKVFA